MIVINLWIGTKFNFLITSRGFEILSESSNDIVYQSGDITLRFFYNERDGFDVILYNEKIEISLTTVLGAINTYQGNQKNETNDDPLNSKIIEKQIKQIANFLQSDGALILKGDNRLLNELEKIQFYHVGEWVEEWGTSIEMTPMEIQENRALIPKILELLKG